MIADKNETLTAEDKDLREYELVLIISPEVADEAFEAKIKSISRLITNNGGVISDMQQLGKKKLAYPLKHFLEGNYVLAKFKMNPAGTKELSANLKITEDILRQLLVRLA